MYAEDVVGVARALQALDVVVDARDDEHPVRDLLRSGASDEDIALLLRQAVWAKRPGHGINDPSFLRPARSMSMIGG